MPKDTLHTLPREKRDRVLKAATRLFAKRGYERTDMAEIARRAGVAKGSLYNYFHDKEDLYLHMALDGLERHRHAVYGGIDPVWDVFRQVEHVFRQGARFALAHPEYVLLYLNASAAGMEWLADQLTLDVEKFTADHLKGLIRRGIEAGIVRRDADPGQAAFLINGLYINLVLSLVSKHFQIRMREYLDLRGR